MNRVEAQNQIMHSHREGAASLTRHAKLLPRNELIATARKAQNGDPKALETIIHAMSRMIHQISTQQWRAWSSILPPSAQYDDVYQAGVEGLLIALKKYDPDSDNTLTTYAKLWIQQKTQRTIYNMIGHMHIPEGRVRKGIEHDSLLIAKRNYSINQTIETRSGETRPLTELIADPNQQNPAETYDDTDKPYTKIINTMSIRHQQIANLAIQGNNDPQIANIIGTSTTYVAKILKQIQTQLIHAGCRETN